MLLAHPPPRRHTRYREPARDLDQLVERLRDADIVVSIRERVEFSRALLERLPKLKLIALVGRNAQTIDFAACTALGIPVATGESNSPVAPAELTLALIVASRRNVALEAERMRRGDWPCTLSHRLRGSTLGIFGLGHIGQLVAEGGRGLGMNVLVWGQKSSLSCTCLAGRSVRTAVRTLRRAVAACPAAYDNRGSWRHELPHEADRADREHVARRGHRAGLLLDAPQGRPGYAAVDVCEQEPIVSGNHPSSSMPACVPRSAGRNGRTSSSISGL